MNVGDRDKYGDTGEDYAVWSFRYKPGTRRVASHVLRARDRNTFIVLLA
jgi:hypothetical protein